MTSLTNYSKEEREDTPPVYSISKDREKFYNLLLFYLKISNIILGVMDTGLLKEADIMDERPIGVFDSGLGGLTVVKELMDELPSENIIYLGDTGRVPYGGRSRATIMKYARQDIAFLLRFDIKAVVAACGTVSTNGLEEIVGDFTIPVRGVLEPAARAAVRETRSGRIGIIGTKASIGSGAYDRRIKEFMPQAQITTNACPLFVPLVEEGRIRQGDIVLETVAREYLEPLLEAQVDTLIMGCTHYPLIREVIAGIMGPQVRLVDPGAETAMALRAELEAGGLLRQGDRGQNRYFVTDSAEGFSETGSIFLKEPLEGSVEHVSLDDF